MQIPGRLDLYNVAVFLHITAAMVAFGVVLLWPIAMRATAARSGGQAQGVYALGAQVHQRVVTPAMGAITVPGLRRLAEAEGPAILPPRVRLAGVISALLVVVVLALMVFKPGS